MSPFPNPSIEQVKLAISYEEKWRTIATCTSRINPARVTKIIHELYQFLKENPAPLVFAESPFDAILKLQKLIENRKTPLTRLNQSIQKKLKRELTIQLIRYPDVCVYPSALNRQMNQELIPQLHYQVHHFLKLEIVERKRLQSKFFAGFENLSWNYIAPEEWACDASYLDWLCNCLKCKHDPMYWTLFEALLTECGWIFPFKEICIVCDHPTHISFDSERRLHAESSPALEFLDDFCIFARHGIKLPEYYGTLSPKKWKAQWYIQTQDASVRKLLIQNLPDRDICQNWLIWEPDRDVRTVLVQKLSAQIKSMTREQRNSLEDYRQKWKTIALQLSPINQQKVTEAIHQFYQANDFSSHPKVLFAGGLYEGGRLVKKICRQQRAVRPSCHHYGKYNPRRHYGRGDFGNARLLNKFWISISAQLGEEVFQEIYNSLIVDRSWSVDPLHDWIKPESLTPWCSLFDFCISVLGCVHDSDFWSVLKSIVQECGWFYPSYKTCIVCDRPLKISVDEQGRLHDSKAAAIIFADGYRVRAVHGQRPRSNNYT